MKPAATIEQIYVTNRRREAVESVEQNLTICGSSTDDPLLLRAALEYPYAEIQTDAVKGGPASRLALVRIPGGKSALIRSLSSSRENPDGPPEFFCHVLIHPSLKACEALTTWDSDGWARPSSLNGHGSVGRTAKLPPSGPIDDRAIEAFLQPELAQINGQGFSFVCPDRLRAMSAEHRRQLLKLVLRGCQLVLDQSPLKSRTARERSHFYIVAEPELTALLLYAATRILPEVFSARLTFSTWEPISRLREYDHARVVGTYAPGPETDLEEEYYTTYGYALNTFTLKHSSELASHDPLGIDSWIDRAAQGDWQHLDEMNLFLRKARIVSLDDAKAAYRLCTLLANEKAQSKDLVVALKAPWGAAILERYREALWPQVLDASLTDPLLAEGFADLIAQHLSEVEQIATMAIREGSLVDWKSRWRLLRMALRDDVEKLRETLARILPESPIQPGFRSALLEELSGLPIPKDETPARFQFLVKNCSAQDLDLLANSKVDKKWLVWAYCHALVQAETASEAAHRLHQADDVLIKIFWEQFLLLANEGQRRAILEPLFPASDEGARFLIRSLKHLSWLSPDTLLWLLDSFGAFQKERANFWLAKDNLQILFQALQSIGEAAEPIWQRICWLIDVDLLVPGNAGQKGLLLELWAAENQPGISMPADVALAVKDWMFLQERFEKASALPVHVRQEVIDICNRLHLDPVPVLAQYFERYISPHGLEKESLDDFAGFFHSFFLEAKEYRDYVARLMAWLNVVENCPNEGDRILLQSYYLFNHVPAEFHWRLAQDLHQTGRLMDAIRGQIPKPTEIDMLGIPQAILFQLTGARSPAPSTFSLPLLGWFSPTILASVLVAGLCVLFLGLGNQPRSIASGGSILLFIPAVALLADSLALHSTGTLIRDLRGFRCTWNDVRRVLWQQMGIALLVGIVSGLLGGCLAYFAGTPVNLAWKLGGVLILAMASAPLGSLAVPLLFRRLVLRLPYAGLSRATASVTAVVIFLSLAWALVG
jgi:hypothetical protein